MKKRQFITLFIIALVMTTIGALTWKLLPGFPEKATQSITAILPKVPTPTNAPIVLRNKTKPFFGPVLNKKNNRFVVKNPDGKALTIILSNKTTFTGGKENDLLAGKKVSGIGRLKDNGEIEATTIQINPQSLLNRKD